MESLGERFKQERERKGMTLDDVAVSTKIGTRMLQALEDERYELLPGGIFNKGFVRAYARHLGLDEEQAIADYMAKTGPPPVEAQPVVVLEALAAHAVETHGQRLDLLDSIPWGKLSIFLLVVAILLTIWGPRPSEKPKQKSGARSSEPAATPDLRPSGEPVLQKNAGVPSASSSSVLRTAAKASAVTVVGSRGAFSLRIQANQDSWVSISADGKKIFQELLLAHGQKSVEANREILVKAGNVGGLDFWFNGKKLATQGNTDKVKTLVFGAAGLQSATAKVELPLSNAEP